MARQNTRPGPDPHEVKRLEDAANSGDARAALLLATMYNFGIGVSANGNTANALYIKAAELGSAEAKCTFLGICCGAGSSQDRPECTRLLEKAANLGSARAMYLLGATLRSNLAPATAISATIAGHSAKGLDVTREKAARIEPPSCGSGHAKAAFDLGSAYLRGEGVESSPAEAVVYFRKAAALGHVPAMRRLRRNFTARARVLSQRTLASFAQFYRKAASFGDSEATIELALMYRHGQYGLTKDSAEAMRHFRSARITPPSLGVRICHGHCIGRTGLHVRKRRRRNQRFCRSCPALPGGRGLGNAAAFCMSLPGCTSVAKACERNAERAARLAVVAIEKKEPALCGMPPSRIGAKPSAWSCKKFSRRAVLTQGHSMARQMRRSRRLRRQLPRKTAILRNCR